MRDVFFGGFRRISALISPVTDRHGPFDLRWKRSVANACKNATEKERNRRRFIPTVPIRQEFEPGGVTPDDLPGRSPPPDDDGERVVRDFRRLVRRRLGELGAAALDVRMAGGETKSLVGRPSLAARVSGP